MLHPTPKAPVPTAATLTPAQRAAYRSGLADRAAARQAAVDRRHARAWALAREAAGRLRERFGPLEIWAFGSLALGRGFHERSDIDLGVRGLPSRAYLDAVVLLLSLDNDFLFDLVRLEEAPEGLRASILSEGSAL